MALRLIEVVLPQSEVAVARRLMEERPNHGLWTEPISEGLSLVRILLPAEQSEAVLDAFEQQFSSLDTFRLMLLPVEASLPRPEEEKPSPQNVASAPAEAKPAETRISREELYADMEDSIRLSRVFLLMVILSSTVAAIGLLRNDLAVIIAAMVIAPLLGPNVALSLATTLGDIALARRALKTNAVGLLVALAFSVVLGTILDVNLASDQLRLRTQVGLADVALALASGTAGALAFTTGVSATLIGVMVAVALLPPLVAFGLLMGSGNIDAAWGAALLLVTNVICVNLAGVVTFVSQGIRPATWWETDRAQRATRLALLIWLALLVALVLTIFLSRTTPPEL